MLATVLACISAVSGLVVIALHLSGRRARAAGQRDALAGRVDTARLRRDSAYAHGVIVTQHQIGA